MTEPRVSIVIPCYNHDQYVQECIDSVIAQDYRNIELIIIDDGSKDDSVKVIEQLVPACLRRFSRFEFRSRPNKGLCSTLNEALEWCAGEFYSAIASDDVMLADKTARQVDHLIKNPECDCVFGGVNFIDSNSKFIRSEKSNVGTFGFKEIFLGKRPIAAPTQMIRTESIREVGGYSDRFYIEDWYMWLRLASIGAKFCDIGDILANYRWHANNSSASLDVMKKDRRKILEQYRDHPLYNRAYAAAELTTALDYQVISKSASIKYLANAIAKSPFIILDIRFFKCIAKFFIPNKLIGRNRV